MLFNSYIGNRKQHVVFLHIHKTYRGCLVFNAAPPPVRAVRLRLPQRGFLQAGARLAGCAVGVRLPRPPLAS